MISFPQMNIATSVVNRILNAHSELTAHVPVADAIPRGAPNVPNAAPLGADLDAAIAAPEGPLGPTDPALPEDLAVGALFP